MNPLGILIGALLALIVIVPVAVIWAKQSLVQTRRALRRAQSAERLAELGALTGGLAHEIKNPLSTLNINLQLLNEDLKELPDPEVPQAQRIARKIKTLQVETDRLAHILEDFLRFAGKHELKLKSVDLNHVIEQLIDFFAPQAQADGITLRSELSHQSLIVSIDIDLIKQAMLNLMINAQQAMSAASMGTSCDLILRTRREQDQAVVDVIDTGPGIKSNDLDKIFQAYYSTKSGGTGLGLPTTRHIVNEHHGTIQADSLRGQGTCFTIRLPAEQKRSEIRA